MVRTYGSLRSCLGPLARSFSKVALARSFSKVAVDYRSWSMDFAICKGCRYSGMSYVCSPGTGQERVALAKCGASRKIPNACATGQLYSVLVAEARVPAWNGKTRQRGV